MRARATAIFFAGFASGMLFLAVLLWRTHSLLTIKAANNAAPAGTVSAPRPHEIPGPVSVPAANIPDPARLPARPPELLIPVEGVAAGELRDSFQEKRDGHSHQALDIPAPRGTPVRAAAQGNVVKLFQSMQGGLTVYQFDDSRNWCFYYAHLDHYAHGLTEGTLLRQGDVLGYVGVTGDAAGTPHLHFAIFKLSSDKRWWEGTAIDPYPFLSGQTAWPP